LRLLSSTEGVPEDGGEDAPKEEEAWARDILTDNGVRVVVPLARIAEVVVAALVGVEGRLICESNRISIWKAEREEGSSTRGKELLT
jgi:hypothetical protein